MSSFSSITSTRVDVAWGVYIGGPLVLGLAVTLFVFCLRFWDACNPARGGTPSSDKYTTGARRWMAVVVGGVALALQVAGAALDAWGVGAASSQHARMGVLALHHQWGPSGSSTSYRAICDVINSVDNNSHWSVTMGCMGVRMGGLSTLVSAVMGALLSLVYVCLLLKWGASAPHLSTGGAKWLFRVVGGAQASAMFACVFWGAAQLNFQGLIQMASSSHSAPIYVSASWAMFVVAAVLQLALVVHQRRVLLELAPNDAAASLLGGLPPSMRVAVAVPVQEYYAYPHAYPQVVQAHPQAYSQVHVQAYPHMQPQPYPQPSMGVPLQQAYAYPAAYPTVYPQQGAPQQQQPQQQQQPHFFGAPSTAYQPLPPA